MRITALSSALALGALALGVHPASADRAAPTHHAKIAAVLEPARPVRGEPTLTGELGLTGARHAPREERFLAAREITAEIAPHGAEIQRCYLDHLAAIRRPGQLDLTFVISRRGDVLSLQIAAPGLAARTARAVETCIRDVVSAVQFPERRNDTTAIVPYYFQKTVAPHAGPQLSCWNAKGC